MADEDADDGRVMSWTVKLILPLVSMVIAVSAIAAQVVTNSNNNDHQERMAKSSFAREQRAVAVTDLLKAIYATEKTTMPLEPSGDPCAEIFEKVYADYHVQLAGLSQASTIAQMHLSKREFAKTHRLLWYYLEFDKVLGELGAAARVRDSAPTDAAGQERFQRAAALFHARQNYVGDYSPTASSVGTVPRPVVRPAEVRDEASVPCVMMRLIDDVRDALGNDRLGDPAQVIGSAAGLCAPED